MSDNHAVAQAVHDLGSAVWFGGSVMGVAGVNKSGEDLTNSLDRVRVANSAWSRFGPVEWAGIGATLLAGLRLTQVGKGRLALQQGFGRTGAVKAGVAVAGTAATAWSTYCGMKIGKLTEEFQAQGGRVHVEDATTPAADTPPEIARWQKRERVDGCDLRSAGMIRLRKEIVVIGRIEVDLVVAVQAGERGNDAAVVLVDAQLGSRRIARVGAQ